MKIEVRFFNGGSKLYTDVSVIEYSDDIICFIDKHSNVRQFEIQEIAYFKVIEK